MIEYEIFRNWADIERKLVNPPYFVLSSQITDSFVASAIRFFEYKKHTKNGYSHAMTMLEPGFFYSQNWHMEKVPIETYLNGKTRLKFFWGPNWTEEEKHLIDRLVRVDLKNKIDYDVWGILGQALSSVFGINNLRFIQSNSQLYCSEQVGNIIRAVDKDCKAILPNPRELDIYLSQPKYKAMVFEPTD